MKKDNPITPKLTRIKAALRQHIEEAEKATAGPWRAGELRYAGKSQIIDHGPYVSGGGYVCEVEAPFIGAEIDHSARETNAAFIAHARTMSPLACKGLLMAIDWIEQSFALLNTISLSPCNGGSCMVATDADDALQALTRQTQAKLQEIESLFPDEN